MVRQTDGSVQQKSDSESAYEIALQKALAERAAIAERRKELNDALNDLATRDAELEEVARALLSLLPPDRHAVYSEGINSSQRGVSARATQVFGTVIHLLPRQREWTAPDMQQALKAEGIRSDLKPIHNALNYLAREGRLQRIARGRYFVRGYGFEITATDEEEAQIGETWRGED